MFRAIPTAAALLASVLTLAAPAFAEVKFSGEAKMGLVFDGEDLRAASGVRLTAHAYGVTDGGLEYGIVMNSYTGDQNPFDPDDTAPSATVYIQSGNHTVRFGRNSNNADHIPADGSGIDRIGF